jgi:hypothetical protein
VTANPRKLFREQAVAPIESAHHDPRVLHDDLLNADDDKVRRILDLIEGVSDPAVNEAVFGPLRSRLAALKPVRPLRFTRLLFHPLDPLIVPAHEWRASEPTVPRAAIMAISRVVRTGIGDLADAVDATIAGHGTDAVQAVDRAGEMLWARAGEVLAVAPPPVDWADTGIRHADYAALAHSIAAVLRRAVWMESLYRDRAAGALEPNTKIVNDIMRNIASEPGQGYAMIARLMLLRSPDAAPLMRDIVLRRRDPGEMASLRAAVANGTHEVLTYMESASGLATEIGRVDIAGAGGEVRRMVALLLQIENDAEATRHRPRLKAIRGKLDTVCRDRFATGVREVLVAPLEAVSGPITKAGQTQLEAGARDLRTLESVGRTVGSPASYDSLLSKASETVREAVGAGTLTPMRGVRLVEILSGPEAAVSLYQATNTGQPAKFDTADPKR